MIKEQVWIKAEFANNYKTCPVFRKEFETANVKKAELEITAKGVYDIEINGIHAGDFVLAPGFTVYSERHQYQTYNVTDLVKDGKNVLDVTVSAGWYNGRIANLWFTESNIDKWDAEIIASLKLEKNDGTTEYINTDETWLVGHGAVEFADIYDGEIYNATKKFSAVSNAYANREASVDMLIPQEGEKVTEHEIFAPAKIITTQKGETVIDFGQNLTGYPQITVNAAAGEKVSFSFGEILDGDGNFYNKNYRSALCKYEYTCKDGLNIYKPTLTFYGFRYIRVDEFPKSAELTKDNFRAIAVYSNIKKTGTLLSGHKKLNQLFSNIVWGQKCNLLDVPTDCPQRDERLGWTGDAQVIVKTASYCFDVERFFKKWLRDMKITSETEGNVSRFVPNVSEESPLCPAWSDVAVIAPWQIYITYGDKDFLREMLPMMEAHISAITAESDGDKYTWKAGKNTHNFGDWLGMDAPAGSYMGSTRTEIIQSAFYAYDLSLMIKVCEVLDLDASEYKESFNGTKKRFNEDFPELKTQTECALALYFDLAEDKAAVAAQLADLVIKNGGGLATGFVGTPYLLYALSENGYTDLAYQLLVREEYPSWLFSVNMGATTMWEHWDGINDKGEIWSSDMNSFNHYAYGAVGGWIYEVAAGIQPCEGGFAKVRIAPSPDERLGMLEACVDTRAGRISSKWQYENGRVKYEITVPTTAELVVDGKTYNVSAGTYIF